MWSVIIVLILIGFLMLLLEILVIPGTGIAGILGFALMAAGIWVAYRDQGMISGHLALSGTLALNLVGLVVAFRSKTWQKAALSTEIKGKAGQNVSAKVQVGDIGITISRCTPGGTAEFNDQLLEVTTQSQFIDPQQKIEIINISGNKIIVKQLN
jgi:membrane-bound ClpP family serine protease